MSKVAIYLGVSAVFLGGVLAGLLLSRSAPIGGSGEARKVQEALELLRQSYVEELAPGTLADGAIEGMVELLDHYSMYLRRDRLSSVREEIEGHFGGIGIWFEMVDDTARVVSVMPDSPSERVGVIPGDRIVAIGDSSCVGRPSLEIQDRIKGPTGTTVALTVLRPSLNKRFSVTIERADIAVHSVEAAFRLDPTTGYIRIARFTSSTGREFAASIDSLIAAGITRLLVDLRDNPGGVLESAIAVADALLAGGNDIVRTEGRMTGEGTTSTAKDGDPGERLQTIVLVNENSASASEIVAGAIQDNDRGLVIGRPTFGKGLVQRQFLFNDGSALHVTVARYYTPAGRPIQNALTARTTEAHGRSLVTTSRDTLRSFSTKHGRTIYGGEGIIPDFQPSLEGNDGALFTLVRQSGLDFSFARRFFDRHELELQRSWSEKSGQFVKEYELPDTAWAEFLEFVRVEVGADRLVGTENVPPEARRRLTTLIKGRIGQLLYGPQIWHAIVRSVDPDVMFAVERWADAAALPGAP